MYLGSLSPSFLYINVRAIARRHAFPPAYQTWPKDAEELDALNAVADNDDYVTLMKNEARAGDIYYKILDLIRNFNFIFKWIALLNKSLKWKLNLFNLSSI